MQKYYHLRKILSLHSKLNRLVEGEDETISIKLPLLCRDAALQRIKQGVYLRDLNFTIQMVLTYFKTIKQGSDHLDVVVIDVDELSSTPLHNSLLQHS
ncbi:hypothetical protein Bca52824_026857 [Brassica carinata]|uniref:Uncharacterized protein n=1 Tax=Brassica carinata TaxID=52824 RepID=A0A8X7V971_BRACI|nr:hypothetical protein Bca52824_026857 [Brassica carinata]